jgi:predicted dehydrogenase
MVEVAIVGLGWWGKKLATVLSKSNLLHVALGVEPNQAMAAEVSKSMGFPVATDYVAALNDPKISAVILATPHSLHDEQVARAAAAGKHVFCEKPLSLTRAGAETSVRLMREKDLVLGIGHERRWEPPVAQMLRDARSGKFGTLLQYEANFSHDKFVTLDADNWRLSAANAPAGGMTATGIHLFDIASTLFGPAECAFTSSATLASGIANGDSTCALVRYQNGGTAYVSTMLATPFISRMALFGSEGWIEIQDKAHVEAPEGWRVTRCERGGKPSTTEVAPNNAVLENLEAFAKAVSRQAPYPISFDDMIANTAVMEAVFKSARSGKAQRVA